MITRITPVLEDMVVKELEGVIMRQLTDKYGNNTDFSDSIMSDMTIKGLLGKWTARIFDEARTALKMYHLKEENIDHWDTDRVLSRFRYVSTAIRWIQPVLEDLTAENIYGIEDVFIAVYGVMSDEVYVIREFLRLDRMRGEWDADYIWDDCVHDSRLEKILM